VAAKFKLSLHETRIKLFREFNFICFIANAKPVLLHWSIPIVTRFFFMVWNLSDELPEVHVQIFSL